MQRPFPGTTFESGFIMFPVQFAPVNEFIMYAVLFVQEMFVVPVHAKLVTVVWTGASPPCPQSVDEYTVVRM